MSDDSFFREVNEDLRSERMRSFWSRFGWMIIAAVIGVVLATAGWRGYEYWQARQASASGDAFLEALTLARDGDAEEALAALDALGADGFGSYPVLASMRAATLRAEAGDHEAAIAGFRAIGDDRSVPVSIREAARLRAAYLLVDHGSYDDVQSVVSDMTADEHPMRHSARETLGLAAWKAGEIDTARDWFQRILADEQGAFGPTERAEIMLDLITAAGPEGELPPVSEDAPAPETGAETAPVPDAPISLEGIAPELAPGTMDAAPEADGDADVDGATTAPALPEIVPLETLDDDGEDEQEPS
jgi:hypothetical protein